MSTKTRIRMSNGRRLVDDVIRIANKTPLASLQAELDLPILTKLRRYTRPKICWNVLMMKAHAIVCMKNPVLRRLYVKVPWPHFYQYDHSVCMITMAKQYRNEERLFFARFSQPENQSLRQLQEQYENLRRADVDVIPQFKHQVAFAKTPWFVRRFAWWALFNLWPEKRATHMGTFGMSLSGYQGAYGTQLLGPNTTTLGVDPMPRKGRHCLLLTFDHRVIDGKPATDLFGELRHHLTHTITREVKDILIEDGLDPEAILAGNSAVSDTKADRFPRLAS